MKVTLFPILTRTDQSCIDYRLVQGTCKIVNVHRYWYQPVLQKHREDAFSPVFTDTAASAVQVLAVLLSFLCFTHCEDAELFHSEHKTYNPFRHWFKPALPNEHSEAASSSAVAAPAVQVLAVISSTVRQYDDTRELAVVQLNETLADRQNAA